jgi:hypothetical protein
MTGGVDVEIPGSLSKDIPGSNPALRAGTKEVSFF